MGDVRSGQVLADRRPMLAGTWRNELGSELTLIEEPGCVLGGWYRSGVGQTLAPRPLTGSCVRRADGSAVLGFVVGWPSTDSLATWTARYQPVGDQIVATWLLESGSADDTTWLATRLGSDVFQRSADAGGGGAS